MSQQTHAAVPSGPASTRLGDRARFRFARAWATPNPIFVREMRQTARLARTPVGIALVTVITTLIIGLIGAVSVRARGGAFTGYVAHQVFFSLAYFVVTLVGPVIAANVIASEREGRTWEALQLTGLSPGIVARGKFAAAYVSLATYLLALAPVSGLIFLFGGVSPLEVAIGFLFLLVMGALSIAIGLAVSSRLASGRVAMAVTFLAALPISTLSFLGFGLGVSYAAHRLWPMIEEGPPIWYPTACIVAPFDWAYVGILLVAPALIFGMPAWFLYESTIAALDADGDRGSFGIKRWYLVACGLLAAGSGALLAFVPAPIVGWVTIAIVVVAGFFGAFAATLFQGEPHFVPRRVRHRWAKHPPPAVQRLLHPSIARSGLLVAIAGGLPIAVALVICALRGADPRGVWTAVYCLAFHVAIAGVAAAIRVTSAGGAKVLRVSAKEVAVAAVGGTGTVLRVAFRAAGGARGAFVAGLTGLAFVPWIVAGLATLISEGRFDDWMWLAAPTPTYVFSSAYTTSPMSGWVMSGIWAAVGAAGLFFASHRSAEMLASENDQVAAMDARLADEDARWAAAREEAERRAAEAEAVPAPAEAPPDAPPEATTDAAPEPPPDGSGAS